MDYQEAFKKISASKKVTENYLVIQLNYSNKLILPHKDGLAFLASMQQAERLEEEYSKNARITYMGRDTFQVSTMSHDVYVHIKVAALLGITPEEAKEAKESSMAEA